MSLLKTIVPVDVQRVIDALPPKSYVHSVKLCEDRQGVEIIWDNDAIQTGRTYAKEFPLNQILSGASPVVTMSGAEPLDKRRKPVKTASRT